MSTIQNLYSVGRQWPIFLMAFILLSCGTEPDAEETEAGPGEEEGIIMLTEEQFSNSGMQLGKMTERPFYTTVELNGMFDVPPENRSSISSYFGGYVKKMELIPGQRVTKGQVLYVLENPEYIHVQEQYLDAKGQLAYLRSDYERQKNLYSDSTTSEKKFMKAEADYRTTLAKFESLKKKLGLMNINTSALTPENIRTSITVTSPISGYVTEVSINQGMYLNPTDPTVNIVNTDHLHLELNLYEQDMNKVKIGQTIRFSIQNDTSDAHLAHVYLISHAINPEKRTIIVHGHLNDEKDVKPYNPGMYVEAEILTDSTFAPALPEQAVVEVENKHFVLLRISQSSDTIRFEQRIVEVGKTVKGHTQILNASEFGPEAEFLVKGAFGVVRE